MKGKGVNKTKSLPKPVEDKRPEERCRTPEITTYDTINEAVHEYLLKSGLFKTVDTFQVF